MKFRIKGKSSYLKKHVVQHDFLRPFRLGLCKLSDQWGSPEYFETVKIPRGARTLEVDFKGMRIEFRFFGKKTRLKLV